jgi:hypothetical protein
MPRFHPPGSLAEHCITWHGFDVGKTVSDQVHRSDHQAHDRAVDWLAGAGPDPGGWGRLSAVLPIRHSYRQILESQEASA